MDRRPLIRLEGVSKAYRSQAVVVLRDGRIIEKGEPSMLNGH